METKLVETNCRRGHQIICEATLEYIAECSVVESLCRVQAESSLCNICSRVCAEAVQSLWQEIRRVCCRVCESLSSLCRESLGRAWRENDRERQRRESERMRVRENIPDSLETTRTFLPEKIQKLLYKKWVVRSSTCIKQHSLSKQAWDNRNVMPLL